MSTKDKFRRVALTASFFFLPWALACAAGAIDNYDEGNLLGQILGVVFTVLILPMKAFSPVSHAWGATLLTSLLFAHFAFAIVNWRLGVPVKSVLYSFLIVMPFTATVLLFVR